MMSELLNPGTFIGAVFAGIIAGFIVGFFSGKTYQQHAKVKTNGNSNTVTVNSISEGSCNGKK